MPMLRLYPTALAFTLAACANTGAAPPRPADRLTDALSNLLAETLAESPAVPGAMLRVEAPALGLVWTRALGQSDRRTSAVLRPDQTLRIASNTKTYVAAAILRLVEDGRLDLDAPIASLLLAATNARLAQGGYDPARISIRMLLEHTSGLFDYASADAFLTRVVADPHHRWTRGEQLALAIAVGSPYGAPGETFRYSDTGYILLGEILETISGLPLHRAVSRLIDLRALGIEHTWFEDLDPVPPGSPPRLHQYIGPLDANTIDASADLFGGGGLISTLADMARFYRAVVRGEVFRHRETATLMQTASPQSLRHVDGGYGMGLVRSETEGLVCYGHHGFWGTEVWQCPAIDVTVAAALTDTTGRAALAALARDALRLTAAAVAAGR